MASLINKSVSPTTFESSTTLRSENLVFRVSHMVLDTTSR